MFLRLHNSRLVTSLELISSHRAFETVERFISRLSAVDMTCNHFKGFHLECILSCFPSLVISRKKESWKFNEKHPEIVAWREKFLRKVLRSVMALSFMRSFYEFKDEAILSCLHYLSWGFMTPEGTLPSFYVTRLTNIYKHSSQR